jgi:hypothetical protein
MVEQTVESEPITRYIDIADLPRVMNGKTKRHDKSTSILRPPLLVLTSEHQQCRPFVPVEFARNGLIGLTSVSFFKLLLHAESMFT